jgi:hypothetical protein
MSDEVFFAISYSPVFLLIEFCMSFHDVFHSLFPIFSFGVMQTELHTEIQQDNLTL